MDLLRSVDAMTIATLEADPSVDTLVIDAEPPATDADLDAWAATNGLLKLPPDLEAFYRLCNGFVVTFSYLQGDDEFIPVGRLQLNTLADMVPVPAPPDFCAAGVTQPTSLPHAACPATPALPDAPMFDGVAFVLDSSVRSGTVAMVFVDGPSEPPSYWFRDRAGGWFLLAKSFTAFLRLQVAHAGLPLWHYSYTPTGLDPLARQWLSAIIPARLALDEQGWRSRFSRDDDEP